MGQGFKTQEAKILLDEIKNLTLQAKGPDLEVLTTQWQQLQIDHLYQKYQNQQLLQEKLQQEEYIKQLQQENTELKQILTQQSNDPKSVSNQYFEPQKQQYSVSMYEQIKPQPQPGFKQQHGLQQNKKDASQQKDKFF